VRRAILVGLLETRRITEFAPEENPMPEDLESVAVDPPVSSDALVVAAAPAEPQAPVPTAERIELIDVVRGVALFGILAANMRGFAGPTRVYFLPHLFWTSMPDRIAQAFIDTFVQGKFIAIFAALFGVGFAAQFTRAESRGSKFGWTYARRLTWLALFGLVHGLLIWWGDILLIYALVGFLLLLFRKRKDLTLKIWGTFGYFFIVIMLTGVLLATTTGAAMPSPPLPTPAQLAEDVAIFADGSWSAIQQRRTVDAIGHNWGLLPVMLLNILGLFLFGLLAWRHRFFQPAPESLPRYRKAMVWGLGLGTAASLTVALIRFADPIMPFPPTGPGVALFALQTAATPALSLGYVCAVVLLFHHARWKRRLHPFGAVGRMALTNYLLQSVIGTLLFYSYGLGLFGRVGPAMLLIPTVLIFAAQVWMSAWWLERFRYGPAEWAWRSLTYRKAQPFVREGRAPVIAQPVA
jgi:uncharacterized protein